MHMIIRARDKVAAMDHDSDVDCRNESQPAGNSNTRSMPISLVIIGILSSMFSQDTYHKKTSDSSTGTNGSKSDVSGMEERS